MAAQRLTLRSQLWPDVSESLLWNRKKEAGFVTVPRTLPLIVEVTDPEGLPAPHGDGAFDVVAGNLTLSHENIADAQRFGGYGLSGVSSSFWSWSAALASR